MFLQSIMGKTFSNEPNILINTFLLAVKGLKELNKGLSQSQQVKNCLKCYITLIFMTYGSRVSMSQTAEG